MIPHRTPFFLPFLYPTLCWRIPTTEKVLYLTFDDGPVYGPTEFVLDVLKQYQCKATFFCIGDNIRKHPALYKRILAEGHRTGNHTFHHTNGWKTPVEDYVANVNACNAQMTQSGLEEHEGNRLFRPPYGRITRKQISLLKNYSIIMWDVLSQDYRADLDPEVCLQKTIQATRTGSIVVFHDSLKAERNLYAVLPKYIEHFQKNGFVFHSL